MELLTQNPNYTAGVMNESVVNWCPVPTHPHWLDYPPVATNIHYMLGIVLLIVGTAGVLGNGLVLFVFTRFRRLRGPFSSFILNLAVADLCTSLLHAMVVTSSFKQRWIFGEIGCMLYAFGVGFFGLLSIVTLSAIAVERYMVITSKPLSGSWKITRLGARKVCVVAWIYCSLMAAPPLFGWSRYEPEGLLTSCSWDYLTRTPNNRSYFIYLLILGFILPVTVIVYCYVFILAAIYAHGREMRGVKATGGRRGCQGATTAVSSAGNSLYRPRGNNSFKASYSHKRTSPHVRSTIRTAEIIMMLVVLFLFSWTPYAVVTCIGQFGDVKLLTPWVASLPAFFAKASVVYNPIVYGLSHPHFRASVKQYLSTCKTGSNSSQYAISRSRNVHPPHQAASCIPPISHHQHIHHMHFRCFPHNRPPGHAHFHSEPDARGVTLILDQNRSLLQWGDGCSREDQSRAIVCVQGNSTVCCLEKPSRSSGLKDNSML